MQYGGDDLELYGGVVPLKEALVVLKTQIKIMVITILILNPKAGFDFAGQLGAAGNVVEGLAGAYS
jgi:hypothetical protein